MEFTGIWSGVWQLAKLRSFVEDDPFQLEILAVESDGSITGMVTEPAPSRGFVRMKHKETITYPVNGRLCNDRLILSGTKHGLEPAEKETVQLELILDVENESLTGNYFYASLPDRKALVDLKKNSCSKR